MSMKKIIEFLDRFKNLNPSKELVEQKTKKIIKELLNIPDSYYRVLFIKPNLTIIASGSVLKNEIFIKKEEVLKRLKNEFGKKAPLEILFKS